MKITERNKNCHFALFTNEKQDHRERVDEFRKLQITTNILLVTKQKNYLHWVAMLPYVNLLRDAEDSTTLSHTVSRRSTRSPLCKPWGAEWPAWAHHLSHHVPLGCECRVSTQRASPPCSAIGHLVDRRGTYS